MRWGRHVLRRVGRVAGSAPVAGAALLGAFFVLELATSDLGFRGFRDDRAIATVFERARRHAIEQQLLILLTLVAAGAAFGGVGGVCGRVWGWVRERPYRYRALWGLGGALVGHGYLLARSVILHPQLYSEHLYDKGGVRRGVMVFLTDRVPIRALDAGIGLIAVFAVVATVLSRRFATTVRTWASASGAFVRRRPRLAGATAAGAMILVAGISILAFGSPSRPRRAAAERRPNVLFLVVDSLRPDCVFGAQAAARFPTLAALAGRGVRFRQAHVTQARTFPSMVTLLTGRFPHAHGIRHEFEPASTRDALGPSLVSALAEAGWRTAVVSDFSGEIFRRARLGFQDVEVPPFDLYAIVGGQILSSHPNALPYATSALGTRVFSATGSMAELDDPFLLADRAVEHLDRLAAGPFMLTVFFSAPHSPYPAPDPYYRMFTRRAYHGQFRYLKQPLPLAAALARPDAEQVEALYHGSVAAVDAAIAILLRRLDDLGLADDTIVVLLGDHGENLFEVRGRGMGHGDHLAGDLANHIPLVIIDPTHNFTPHDVEGIVRDVDLAPSLGGLLGVVQPPGDGVDLLPLLDGSRDTLELDAYSETGLWFLGSGPGYARSQRLPYPDIWESTEVAPDGDIYLQPRFQEIVVTAKQRAIRTSRWKLLYFPTPEGAYWLLFDIIADPQQLRDVAAQHPEVFAQLRARLERWIMADGRTRLVPDAPAR